MSSRNVLSTMIEKFPSSNCREVVVTERGVVSCLEERQVRGKLDLCDRSRVVRKLRSQALDERQLRSERQTRAMTLHLHRHSCQ